MSDRVAEPGFKDRTNRPNPFKPKSGSKSQAKPPAESDPQDILNLPSLPNENFGPPPQQPGPIAYHGHPETLTTCQVADLFQITKRHVQRLVKQGRMPRPVKLGRCSRWVKSDLIEWLKSGCPPELEKAPG